MKILYNLGIRLFSLAVFIAAFFNEKARLLRKGRKNIWSQLAMLQDESQIVWIHSASLGEFEQGRPLIEVLKSKYPEKKILLTFFSPSGYEVRKEYELADVVTYLPADTIPNARRFLNLVNPCVALFIKYEFWPNFFQVLREREVSLYSVSAIFRMNQLFFKWYGAWFRKALRAVDKFYVQDQTSGQLLKNIQIENFAVVGDTRFDRVTAIVSAATEVPVAKVFAASAEIVLVAGSSWPPDEDILIHYINQAPENVKMIIAPHEIHEGHLSQIEQKLSVASFRYTGSNGTDFTRNRVMIVDTIGLLSAIYRYGHVAYIGGGFGRGIHNTLEAATYSIPVLFGPCYHKFKEACDLIDCGGGFSVSDFRSFSLLAEKFRTDECSRQMAGKAAGNYVQSMCGATDIIMKEVFS
jgi:3-deoxy-D-manno-octulosonic-acid transferase